MTTMMVISYIVTWINIIYSWLIAPNEEESSDYL
ncbi:hypothetical protein M2451_001416 [Dysgonomonas sp. PFB1-18]|nr:hypothetical protein [Dysgonomonas sp. PF1-14]MDH6338454.1 hypothetical protein [Dysgonomonas sp. PF1-16]MDH6380099.1 hypothetical protein [Dysgonomonas sp. PFB1-18]MDH6397282.1 hypothetical protein [Dysgonomonas sp. PF1-23]